MTNKLPPMNNQKFRIISTENSKGSEDLYLQPTPNALAQFMYKGYEISMCQSLVFDEVLVAVLFDNEVISHHYTVDEAIRAVDEYIEFEAADCIEEYLFCSYF